jgi:trk system potassium uptake protein TrkA
MKYLIIGLGSFGASLAIKLTELGNEVIGVDANMAKVDALKEKISHTIFLDATDQYTMGGLPLKNTDVAIVAIGEDQGSNIIVTALLKNYGVKRLISRALNPLHEKVLHALGVDEIVHPEEETAERWAKKLSLQGVVDSFKLDRNYSIIEADVPVDYLGRTIGEINFREKHNILILTVIKKKAEKGLLSHTKTVSRVEGVATPEMVLEKSDILVLFGSNIDIQSFLST